MYQFIQAVVRYDRMAENGTTKKVTENYLSDALTFSTAEERIVKEVAPFSHGETEIRSMKRVGFFEFFCVKDAYTDTFYKVRIKIITIDEKSGKERISPADILVKASSIDNALSRLKKATEKYMLDFSTAQVSETKIADVFLG